MKIFRCFVFFVFATMLLVGTCLAQDNKQSLDIADYYTGAEFPANELIIKTIKKSHGGIIKFVEVRHRSQDLDSPGIYYVVVRYSIKNCWYSPEITVSRISRWGIWMLSGYHVRSPKGYKGKMDDDFVVAK